MPLQLLQLAEREGIIVEYWDLVEPVEAIYWCYCGVAAIGLSRKLMKNSAHLRTVFGEELGHHFTLSHDCLSNTYYHYKDRVIVSKDESRALRWAALHLIPENELHVALGEKINESWMLAEYFNVDESLVKFRLNSLDGSNN